MEKLTNTQTYNAEVLPISNREEIDIQIATAKKYPRDFKKALSNIRAYATMDQETAEDCFYAIVRGKGNNEKIIEGLSVRFTEIMASCWGNLRIGTRIISNDGRMVTAQGVCHDLESNLSVSVEVKRSILTSEGFTFSNDMQVVTGNAAAAIAYRNAVLRVIPKVVTKNIVDEVKKIAESGNASIKERRERTIAWYIKRGISIERILSYLSVRAIEDINSEKLMILRSTCNAINEGTTSLEEAFSPTIKDKKEQMKNGASSSKKPNLP